MADTPFITHLLAVIRQDNPTYERFTRSDLHRLVAHLRNAGTLNAAATATEMNRVSNDKWRKYMRTRRFLLDNIPGLNALLTPLPHLRNFRTAELSGNGTGIKHVLVWESSTGRLSDLTHIQTREMVTWMAPAPEVRPYLERGYQQGGNHTGLGEGTTGNQGRAEDNHLIQGPFIGAIASMPDNTTLTFSMTQTYQYRADGVNWVNIPGAGTWTIVRTVTRRGNALELTITKSNGHGQTATATRTV
ncbi:hypothetical protein ATI61_108381 [Archangium gephyra]|uniref:Uncharacterized protein n=1 Tax=Archangium gephyra TaxID=48 RepID=A0AAC8Q7M0_9BACT|nr:hypothetical protein [Archangium gephyra]AKJ02229.1 Hypothetical protein AA314_03855 [Archangium gephyra]REG28839.1 hypothetical protein ATI61_108381 [Archangium gephyra]